MTSHVRGALALAALTLALGLASPSAARAEEGDGAAPWAIATYEVTAATSLGLVLTVGEGNSAALAVGIIVPMGLAIGAGVLAFQNDWSPSPALALHGAMWTAGIFFLMTATIEGTARGGAFEVGPAAYTMGAIGLVLGATYGALRVGPDAHAYWLGGPVVAVPAMILGGIIALFGSLNGWPDERVGRTVAFSTAGAGLIGLTVAYALAGKNDPPEWMSRVQPNLVPTRRGATLGLTGSF